MPRAVVSGGAGFIGSHLCERLVSDGYEVIVVDNLITGSTENLSNVTSSPGFEFVKHDVSKPFQVDGPVDLVLHLASPASPIDFEIYPIQIVKVGTLGTHNMLGLAREKSARFLVASTSEVYGDPLIHPQPETYWGNVNPIGTRSCYDEAKRCAEAITMAYHRAHGLDTKIIRIFNTYGPRMRPQDGRAIPTFFTKAILGLPLPVFGDGSQTRSVCYVDDLVDGIMAVLEKGDNAPYNLGTEFEITMLALAQKIIQLTGSASVVEHRPLPPDDPKQRRPDLTRTRAALGWEPRVSMEDGLERTMAHFRVAVTA